MRKLFILLLAAGLFTACKDKKTTDTNTTNREKDDYNTQVKDNGDKKENASTDATTNTDNGNTNTTNYSSSVWTPELDNKFVTDCVSEATKGGQMQEAKAQSYCSCMLTTMKTLFPNPEDAGKLTAEDLKSPEMMKLIQACLQQ